VYSDIILWHNQSRHNKGEIEKATSIERGHNPNCGDDLTLSLIVENNIIKEAKYSGSGCAISQASMSIMIDLVKGKSLEEAQTLTNLFLDMAVGKPLKEDEIDRLSDASIFDGLAKMPARVKCGTLGWHCLDTALK
jgi:nitrogen fixation NifU-like protein